MMRARVISERYQQVRGKKLNKKSFPDVYMPPKVNYCACICTYLASVTLVTSVVIESEQR